MDKYDTYDEFKEKCKVANLENECEAVKLFLRKNDVRVNPHNSKIIEFFKDKNIFITGATGFLGKLLLEKLLRACPNLNSIYVLVRPKKGKTMEERVDDIFKDPVYFPLQDIFPKYREKVHGIQGDISFPELGMSERDRKFLSNKINVIFHVAATTKFDEFIGQAVAINVKGTKEVVKLGKLCVNLNSLVYVSTAFSQCTQKHMEEKFYDPPINSDQLIGLTEKHSKPELEKMLTFLLGQWPNTYCYTKAVAEDVVKNTAKDIRACVYRPSIVVSTYQEPHIGWIDNMFGPIGALAGTGCGLLRVYCADEKVGAEMVPADYVTNGMITAAYKTAQQKVESEPKVYNFVSGRQNKVTWGEFMDWNKKDCGDVFPMRAIWYFSLMLTKHVFMFKFLSFFLHTLPAVLMDIVLKIYGSKISMMKSYEKIEKFMLATKFVSCRDWSHTDDNTRELWESLNDSDKRAFPFDIKNLNWKNYTLTIAAGARTFLLKESWGNLAQARKRRNMFYVLHQLVKLTFGLLFFRIVYMIFTMFY
ncbi:unnamed protein product [Brassicogethes aeneus]|uniref:Fatty acyl-CoA reductase n=1 Tax=Brassicogethes aeneus TaxID=1431903 RepID=A0A9P0AU61_BRAAE|nr:unnamed protein product [Brassicogethes aeneus]